MRRAILFILWCLWAVPTWASTTTLTGTFRDAQGNSVNGTVVLQLAVAGQDVDANVQVVPRPISCNLVNGVLTSCPPVNDLGPTHFQPNGNFYQFKVYDGAGSLIEVGNVVITGATFNLGAAPPTSITTSNISYLTPALLQANNIFTGNENHTGIETYKNLNNALIVDTANSQGWAGADIGAWINAAYAALPAAGGRILVFCNATSSAANFSTPIVFNTSNKYVKLQGICTANSSGSGVVLNYTPTTATIAMTFDYTPAGGGGYTPGNGMEGIVLANNGCVTNGGCGSSATGIQFGNTNGGAHMADFTNVRISGFGTGINFNDTVGWGVKLNNFHLAWNTVGGTFTQPQESIAWTSGSCAVNGTCWTTAAIAASDLFVSDVSIDSNTVGGMTGALLFTCSECHFENLSQPTVNYVNLTTGSIFAMFGGDAVDDNLSGTVGQFFTLNLASGYLHGVSVGTGGQNVTSLFNLSGGTGAIAYGDYFTASPSHILAPCSSDSACDFAVSTGYNATASLHNRVRSTLYDFFEGTAPTGLSGEDICYGDSTLHRALCSFNNAAYLPLTVTVGTGSVTTAGTAIAAGTCQAQTNITVTGTLTSDAVAVNFAGALPASWASGIQMRADPISANTVQVALCNPTAGSITPAATTVHVTVSR